MVEKSKEIEKLLSNCEYAVGREFFILYCMMFQIRKIIKEISRKEQSGSEQEKEAGKNQVRQRMQLDRQRQFESQKGNVEHGCQ